MSILGNNAHQSTISDTAQIILKQLEQMFNASELEVMKNSKMVTKSVNKYITAHPYMSAGSALLLGSVIALLINSNANKSAQTRAHARKTTIDFSEEPQKISDILSAVTDEVKKHSIELCEAAVADFVKKKPLQATGVALAAGLVLTLLSRK